MGPAGRADEAERLLPVCAAGDACACRVDSGTVGRRGGRPVVASSGSIVRELVPALTAAAMPGIGVLLYSAFIWNLTGNPLEWAAGHRAWGREYQGLSVLVTQHYEYLSDGGLYGYTSQLPEDLLNALGVLFVLV